MKKKKHLNTHAHTSNLLIAPPVLFTPAEGREWHH